MTKSAGYVACLTMTQVPTESIYTVPDLTIPQKGLSRTLSYNQFAVAETWIESWIPVKIQTKLRWYVLHHIYTHAIPHSWGYRATLFISLQSLSNMLQSDIQLYSVEMWFCPTPYPYTRECYAHIQMYEVSISNGVVEVSVK